MLKYIKIGIYSMANKLKAQKLKENIKRKMNKNKIIKII